MAGTHATGLPPLTPAQRDVVLADARHLLVGAGAGSGKTSTVVQKLCYLLGGVVRDIDGASYSHPLPLALGDIAAITFTNEAAADLKRKLRSALAASGLRHLATDVDAARIGTIHGFCGDLLREHALRAGLPPTLKVLLEGEATALAAECARLAVQHAVQWQSVPAFAALLEGRTLSTIVSLVAEVASDSDRLSVWQAHREFLRPHEEALLTLAVDALALRQQELARSGAMDFDRMIVAVRDLLRSDVRVRHAVQRQLQLLIVDEFQDVDPAQRDLTFLLGGLEFDDPTPTRIMLVGDPKQSIYKFRRADVSLWNGVADRFASIATGAILELSDNFRSRKGILAFVDSAIGTRLDTPVNAESGRRPFEVDYRPLDARGTEAHGDRCVEVIAVAATEDGEANTAPVVRAAEAQAVAARIIELKAAGEVFGDMAMLLATLSDVDCYRDALRAAGIPFYVLRSDGFWEAREVVDCLLALRAIRNCNDDVALIGFLRSPFVGLRDDTLLALRDARHPNGLVGALSASTRESQLCTRACDMLVRFGALRDRIPTHALLERLLTESGFLAALSLGVDRGTQAMANMRKLLRTTAMSPELSLGEFLRDVNEARARADRVGEEKLYRERADVVTITTVHSAKGLEWPIVFWSDLVRGARPDRDKLTCGRTGFRLRLEEGETDSKGKVIDAAHDEMKSAVGEEDAAELLRRWYVAATRAKRLLVLSGVPLGVPFKAKDSAAAMVRATFSTLTALPMPTRLTYAHSDGTEFELVVQVAAPTMDAGVAPVLNDVEQTERARNAQSATGVTVAAPAILHAPRGRTRLSATQLMTFAADPMLWYRRYSFNFEPDKRSTAIGGASGSASSAAIGTVVHEVLERFNFEVADIDELITSALERHDPDAADTATSDGYSIRDRIRRLVESAIGSTAWMSLALEPSSRRELKFTRVLPDGSVIDGALDLIALHGGTARILDVKTGAAKSDSALADRYRVQAAVYQEVVHAIAGWPTAFSLLSTSDGRETPVTATGVELSSLLAELRTQRPPEIGRS